MSDLIPLPAGVTVFERGWLSSNNILFTGTGGTALVDSGYCTHADQSLQLVGKALGDRALDLLLNTHLHSDHCGGNAALQAHYRDLRTLIPPGLAAQVREWDPVALTYEPTGQECPRFEISDVLRPGTEILLGDRSWQVHAAPGHDAHSIILFEPQSRTLISADALWESGFGVVFQELEGERAFEEVGFTLDLIEVLNPLLVIPGHGKLFTNVVQSIAVARRRLDGFLANPAKHATHAAKVLLKFKLLEVHHVPLPALIRWAMATPYFGLVHHRWFASHPMKSWIEDIVRDLARTGALELQDDLVLNR